MPEPLIKTVEERLVYNDPENPWVKLYFDRVQLPSGRMAKYNRVVEINSEVALTIPKQADGQVGLVRGYKYAVRALVWEFPRGFFEPGSSAEQNANRELAEETGLSASKLTSLGWFYANAGRLATRVHAFLAEDLSQAKDAGKDEDEHISEFRFFAPSELEKLVLAGETDAVTNAALCLAKIKGLV